MSESYNTNEYTVDIVIPIKIPVETVDELINRINKPVLTTDSSHIRIDNIFIVNIVNDKRYEETQMIDGIMNFSYEDGYISFNGVQTKDDDIIHFDKDDEIPVKVIYLPESESKKDGSIKRIYNKSNADYILYVAQNVLPMSKYMIVNMLEPFKNADVNISVGRQTIKKKFGYLERYEYYKCFEKDKGIIEIRDSFSTSLSVIWNYSECVMYRRDFISGFVRADYDCITLYNEDVMLLDYLYSNKMVAAFADTYVQKTMNVSNACIFLRSHDLYMADKYCKTMAIEANIKSGMKLIGLDLGDLIEQKKCYLGGKLFTMNFMRWLGRMIAKLSDKIPDEWYGKVMKIIRNR